MIEIKGTCPIVTWRNGKPASYTAGQLAKLPRQIERFEELKATTRLTFAGIIELTERIQAGIEQPSKPCKTEKKRNGSVSGRQIDVSHLPKYIALAERLMGTNELKTTGRQVVTAEDIAIFLMLLKYLTQNMNEDGTLPHARFKRFWNAVYEAGDIDRAFDNKRFAAIRNYMSSLNLLEWADNTYSLGNDVEKGRACKWKASADLLTILISLEQEKREISLEGTAVPGVLHFVRSDRYLAPVLVGRLTSKADWEGFGSSTSWRWEDFTEKVDQIIGVMAA